MANTLPIRKLGSVGVITDASPYSIPLNAFSDARNILFDENRTQRAPVFKTLYAAIRSAQAYSTDATTYDNATGTYENTLGGVSSAQRFIGSYTTANSESILVCDVDGTVRAYNSGVLTVVTPITSTVTNSSPWSHCQAAGVSVLARAGMVPYVRNIATESVYGNMRNDWVSTHTAAVIRSYGSYLIAMNITKDVVKHPSMVKWCNPLQYSPDPSSATGIQWNPSSTTLLSGENTLGELRTPLRDGLSLSNSFVLYSQDQVWLMEQNGSSAIFNFRKLFPSGGIIATNCVAEVEGLHFVFGEDDLYTHDGMTKKTIADERIRRHVYTTMDRSKKDSYFLHHDSTLNLVYFCYVSSESNLGFSNTTYCNKAAVFNYRNNNWTFMDLPNVAGGAETALTLSLAGYPSISTVATPKVSTFLGVTDLTNSLTESRVYAVDTPDVGVVKLEPHPETLKPAYIERVGIDLSQETGINLRSYKTLQSLIPQVSFTPGVLGTLTFQLGASDFIDGPITWEEAQTFDPTTSYQIDTRVSGRYLAYRITSSSASFFKLAGFDVDFIQTGKR